MTNSFKNGNEKPKINLQRQILAMLRIFNEYWLRTIKMVKFNATSIRIS